MRDRHRQMTQNIITTVLRSAGYRRHEKHGVYGGSYGAPRGVVGVYCYRGKRLGKPYSELRLYTQTPSFGAPSRKGASTFQATGMSGCGA